MTISEKNSAILQRMLSQEFYLSPLKFVLWSYTWGEGDLKRFNGPRKWQREIMLDIERYLVQAIQQKVITDTFPDFYRHAVASGRGPGKSALIGMLSHWFISTRIGGSTWVAANGEPQLRTKTFPEIAKWVARGINAEFFDISSTSIGPAKWFREFIESPQGLAKNTKYYYVAGQLWSEENPDAFAGAHNFDGEFAIFDEACHDDQTEVMTIDGWKMWKDISMSDTLMTMNPNTHLVEYQKPTRLFRSHKVGTMYHYDVRGADFCVTGNHEMYYTTQKLRKLDKPTFKKRKIEEFKNTNYFLKRDLNWVGVEQSIHTIPAIRTERKQFDEKRLDMDLWLEFLGWYVSEGNIVRQNGLPLCTTISNHDLVVIERCKEILTSFRYSPKVYECQGGLVQLRVHDRQLAQHLSESGVGSKIIRVPRYVSFLSKRQIRIYLDSHREGDGYIKDKAEIIYTSSPKLADDLQELYLKIGLKCSVTKRQLEGQTNWVVDHYATSTADGFVVRASAADLLQYNVEKVRKIDYDGMVYCAEVPNHLLLTRRNGYVIWSGNSAIPENIWTVQEGVFTEDIPDRFWLTFSNPRNNSGAFYDCFHRNKEQWRTTQIDSRTVEGINHTPFNNIIARYGEDSDEARVEVYGQFPSVGDDQFIAPRLVDEAMEREPMHDKKAEIVLGVDVARFGNDASTIAVRKGHWLVKVLRFHGLDTMAMVGKVIEAIREWKPDLTIVDEGGMGAGVLDRLVEQNYKVRGVSFGSRADNPVAYFNKRSEMWGTMRDWLRTASIGSCGDNPAADNKALKNDLCAPKYKTSSNGSIQLESKADMKKRGLPSTDIGDAVALTLAYPVGSGVVSSDSFRLWTQDLPAFDKVIQSYHGAYTEKTMNDSVAATVWGTFDHNGERAVMLLDAWQEKMGYTTMRQRIIKEWHATYGNDKGTGKQYKADLVLFGMEGVGESLLLDLREANVGVVTYKNGDIDLIERVHQTAPLFDSRVVYVLQGKAQGQPISWSRPLLEQCDRFPNDVETGLLDTATRALLFVRDTREVSMQKAEIEEEPYEKDYGGGYALFRENPYTL